MATDHGKPLPANTNSDVEAQVKSVPLPETRSGETRSNENVLDDDELDLDNERRRLKQDSDAQAAQDPAKIPHIRD